MSSSTDGAALSLPVSVKGVLVRDGRVVLVDNPRGEWELPGGKLEQDEQPADCVAREMREELGVEVRVGTLLDAWVYRIGAGSDVLVIAYGCEAVAWPTTLASPEGKTIGLFALDELAAIPLPAGYHAPIRRFVAMR